MENREKRDCYDKADKSESVKRSKKYKPPRLRGHEIDPTLIKHIGIIMLFAIEHYKFNKGIKALDEVGLLCYLSALNGSFDTGDIKKYNGMKRVSMEKLIKRLLDNGQIRLYKGHASKKGIKKQYVCSGMTRLFVRKVKDYILNIKEIPLNEDMSSPEFIRKRKGAIRLFNIDVKKNINQNE